MNLTLGPVARLAGEVDVPGGQQARGAQQVDAVGPDECRELLVSR